MAGEIFRFVTVRPPQRADMNTVDTEAVRTWNPREDDSPLHSELKKARSLDNALQNMTAAAKLYVESAEFVADLSSAHLPIPLGQLDDSLAAAASGLTLNDLSEMVKRIFGQPASELIAGQGYRGTRRRIGDSLIAASIVPLGTAPARPRLVRAMRLLGLLERLAANDPTLAKRNAIASALNALVLLPSDVFPLPAAPSHDREQRLKAHDEAKKAAELRRQETKNLTGELARLKLARAEISRALAADIAASAGRPPAPPAVVDPLCGLSQWIRQRHHDWAGRGAGAAWLHTIRSSLSQTEQKHEGRLDQGWRRRRPGRCAKGYRRHRAQDRRCGVQAIQG